MCPDTPIEDDDDTQTRSRRVGRTRKTGLVDSERAGVNVVHHAEREALSALCVVLDPNYRRCTAPDHRFPGPGAVRAAR